jgi:hypothetical protein
VLAAHETAVTSLVGAILGVLRGYLFRPISASLSIDGGSFFVDDLAVAPGAIAATVAVTVLASTFVAARRIVRAGIGPLGTTRQHKESTPQAFLLLPVVLGVLALAGTSVSAQVADLPARTDLLLIGSFLLLAIGILIAGPYLTLILARMLARRASSAAAVIAVNCILTSPRATFRSVSGLIIAVFMVSLFAGVATTAAGEADLSHAHDLLPTSTVVAEGLTGETGFDVSGLEAIPGVSAVSVLYSTGDSTVLSARDAVLLGFTDIPETRFVDFDGVLLANDPSRRSASSSTVTSTDGLRATAILASTDGSNATIERARTWLETAGAFSTGTIAPGTRADAADTAQLTMINSFATLAYIGISIAILIAGASLAVATVSAVLDRRRTLGLLQLAGMPTSDIRRIVVFGAAVPLFAVVALSVALGFLTAWLMLTGLTEGRRTVGWPEPMYYIALGGSLILALGAVAATFGTIRRSTAITSTRFE